MGVVINQTLTALATILYYYILYYTTYIVQVEVARPMIIVCDTYPISDEHNNIHNNVITCFQVI